MFPCLPVAVAYSSAYRDDNNTKSDPGAVAEKARRITEAYNAATGGIAASVRATSDGSVWVVVTNPSECDPAIHSSFRSYYQQHHIHTWIYTSAVPDTARGSRFTAGPRTVIRGISVRTFIRDSYQCRSSSSCSNHIYDDWTTWGKVLCFIWSLHFVITLHLLNTSDTCVQCSACLAPSLYETEITVGQSFFIHQLIHKWVVLKNNIKIYIKMAPTCFGAVTPSSGSALLVLAKVTVVKIVR